MNNNDELKKSIPVKQHRSHQIRRLSGTKLEIEVVQKSALYKLAIAEIERLAKINLQYVTNIRELQTTLAILQEMLADAQRNQKEIEPETIKELEEPVVYSHQPRPEEPAATWGAEPVADRGEPE